MNKIDLRGRTAVVTGAANGIGYATAARFLESGASVSLWDFNRAALDRAATALAPKGDVQALFVDCGDEASVNAAHAATIARFPVVDILIANAGVAGIMKPLLDTTPDDWAHLLRNDLTSVFLTCRAVVPSMVERGYGRVVIVASVVGLEGAPGNGAYATAKGGVITFTKTLGRELAKTGVVVNCTAPAAIDTPLLSDLSAEYLVGVAEKTPMGRLGTADEAAAQIAWLASEDCSFSVGAVFDLSGGRADY
ncbi:MAG: SDR family NAD(P)-dependent oxidoreductase [Rhodospirillales bacterium]|nr:SDR family NAD(P)-dependent oxidoreductase [Rhodospirillales bacterium]